MQSKCFAVNEKDTSSVKGMLAKKLHSLGFTQKDISSMLSITQPMVSRHLKQPLKSSKPIEKALDFLIRAKKPSFYFIISDGPVASEEEYIITTRENIITKGREDAILAIKNAVEKLKDKNLGSLLPKVKVNIAHAMDSASSRDDIAAVPSGLVFVNGILRSYSEPEFGASHHLSEILIYAMKIGNVKSVMNIKYDENILKKIRKEGLKCCFLDDGYKVQKPLKDFDILIHTGSFGIEPTTYIFGKDCEDAAEKVLRISSQRFSK